MRHFGQEQLFRRIRVEDASNMLALPGFPTRPLHPTRGIVMALDLPPHTSRDDTLGLNPVGEGAPAELVGVALPGRLTAS
jgi:hypothetical protein